MLCLYKYKRYPDSFCPRLTAEDAANIVTILYMAPKTIEAASLAERIVEKKSLPEEHTDKRTRVSRFAPQSATPHLRLYAPSDHRLHEDLTIRLATQHPGKSAASVGMAGKMRGAEKKHNNFGDADKPEEFFLQHFLGSNGSSIDKGLISVNSLGFCRVRNTATFPG